MAEYIRWAHLGHTYGIRSCSGAGNQFSALNTAFVTAYNAARGDATRTPAAIITKNAAKTAVIANARMLAGVIQKYPAITNTQRSELGLTVPSMPSPIPPPGSAPGMDVGTVVGWTVKIKLHDSTSSTKRGKPPGVSGASVFSFVGATAPADMSLWKFEGNTSLTNIDIAFDSSNAPGRRCG